MALFGPFVDKQGPAVSAALLNLLDKIQQAIVASAAGNVTIGPPTAGLSLTVEGLAGVAGAICEMIGNSNASIDLVVQNLTNGINATTVIAVQDNTGNNFGFMELQCAASNPQLAAGGLAGLALNFGTNLNFPLILATNDTARMIINGVGSVTINAASAGDTLDILGTVKARGPTLGALVDMTPDSGTFVGVGTGFSGTPPSGNIFWTRNGNQVILSIAGIPLGTSNATNFGISGLPANLQPATIATQISPVVSIFNNGVQEFTGQIVVSAGSGTLQIFRNQSAAGWTAGGQKALNNCVICYSLT